MGSEEDILVGPRSKRNVIYGTIFVGLIYVCATFGGIGGSFPENAAHRLRVLTGVSENGGVGGTGKEGSTSTKVGTVETRVEKSTASDLRVDVEVPVDRAENVGVSGSSNNLNENVGTISNAQIARVSKTEPTEESAAAVALFSAASNANAHDDDKDIEHSDQVRGPIAIKQATTAIPVEKIIPSETSSSGKKSLTEKTSSSSSDEHESEDGQNQKESDSKLTPEQSRAEDNMFYNQIPVPSRNSIHSAEDKFSSTPLTRIFGPTNSPPFLALEDPRAIGSSARIIGEDGISTVVVNTWRKENMNGNANGRNDGKNKLGELGPHESLSQFGLPAPDPEPVSGSHGRVRRRFGYVFPFHGSPERVKLARKTFMAVERAMRYATASKSVTGAGNSGAGRGAWLFDVVLVDDSEASKKFFASREGEKSTTGNGASSGGVVAPSGNAGKINANKSGVSSPSSVSKTDDSNNIEIERTPSFGYLLEIFRAFAVLFPKSGMSRIIPSDDKKTTMPDVEEFVGPPPAPKKPQGRLLLADGDRDQNNNQNNREEQDNEREERRDPDELKYVHDRVLQVLKQERERRARNVQLSGLGAGNKKGGGGNNNGDSGSSTNNNQEGNLNGSGSSSSSSSNDDSKETNSNDPKHSSPTIPSTSSLGSSGPSSLLETSPATVPPLSDIELRDKIREMVWREIEQPGSQGNGRIIFAKDAAKLDLTITEGKSEVNNPDGFTRGSIYEDPISWQQDDSDINEEKQVLKMVKENDDYTVVLVLKSEKCGVEMDQLCQKRSLVVVKTVDLDLIDEYKLRVEKRRVGVVDWAGDVKRNKKGDNGSSGGSRLQWYSRVVDAEDEDVESPKTSKSKKISKNTQLPQRLFVSARQIPIEHFPTGYPKPDAYQLSLVDMSIPKSKQYAQQNPEYILDVADLDLSVRIRLCSAARGNCSKQGDIASHLRNGYRTLLFSSSLRVERVKESFPGSLGVVPPYPVYAMSSSSSSAQIPTNAGQKSHLHAPYLDLTDLDHLVHSDSDVFARADLFVNTVRQNGKQELIFPEQFFVEGTGEDHDRRAAAADNYHLSMWMASKIRDFTVDAGTGSLFGGTPLLMGGSGAKIKTPTNSANAVKGVKGSVKGTKDDDDDYTSQQQSSSQSSQQSQLISQSSQLSRIGPSRTGSIFSNYVSNVHGVFGGASYTIDPAAYTTCIRQTLNEKFLKRFLKWVDWAHVKNVATRLMNKGRLHRKKLYRTIPGAHYTLPWDTAILDFCDPLKVDLRAARNATTGDAESWFYHMYSRDSLHPENREKPRNFQGDWLNVALARGTLTCGE